ncbi:hypothetical protein ABVK25_008275 [Lepraria finkii]|uniref:Aminoglycoside phosphotransferase domain-containing protein n=1 Tax=Lepraria finkii TaxID=1340010 RepID=A0ABR4B1Z2_9LECA
MDDTGFLCDDGYSCCHLDLNAAPRNVMVNIQADGPAAITGILDWDSAVFGPKFVGCAPPIWLWAWNREGIEDEREADDTPPTLEQQELKTLVRGDCGARLPEVFIWNAVPTGQDDVWFGTPRKELRL